MSTKKKKAMKKKATSSTQVAAKVKAALEKQAHSKTETRGLIKYIDDRLAPATRSPLHPIYLNSPDILRVLPKAMYDIYTGLEIAIPPNMVLMSTVNLPGSMQIGGHHHGYQKELVIKLWNTTDLVIEIKPYQKIGHIFLAEMMPWK